MKPTRILIVDDDPSIRKFIRANLIARNYEVSLAIDGEEALRIIEKELPDLVLLDVMMPNVDGFEVCRRLREWSKIPIIMLSARDSEMDKVKCLEYGADDYITKPFSLKELLARIGALLRRIHEMDNSNQSSKYVYHDMEVDLLQSRVFVNNKEIDLTPTEYKMLSYLAANAGRVITPKMLLSRVWGDEYADSNHMLQVNVARLRKKIGDIEKPPEYIITKIGSGYMMPQESER